MPNVDSGFPTAVAHADASQRWADQRDEDEDYRGADEAIFACERVGLQFPEEQVSSRGGAFIVSIRGVG
jgi:hypothetical protein